MTFKLIRTLVLLLDWLAAAYFLIINQDLQKATLFLLFAVIMRLEELSDEIKGEK